MSQIFRRSRTPVRVSSTFAGHGKDEAQEVWHKQSSEGGELTAMISQVRYDVATSEMAPLGGSCGLLHRFVEGTLRGDDYLQLLFHLDHCPRCFDRVRSFPQQKRQQLYALKSGLEEVTLEDSLADPADDDDEELTMRVQEDPPRQTVVREPSNPPADFGHVAKLLEHEMQVIESEIGEVKAKLSTMEERHAELKADLEHLQAATQILERLRGSDTRKVLTPVPFSLSKMNFAHVTQREAILQVLGEDPSQALNKKLLTQALIDGGFPFRAEERTERQNAVYQTCRRMVEGHELQMTIHNRDAFYQLANGNAPRMAQRNAAKAAG
jgi:hypothetical protein